MNRTGSLLDCILLLTAGTLAAPRFHNILGEGSSASMYPVTVGVMF